MSPEKMAEVLDAIESHHGAAASAAFGDAIGSGHCNLVEIKSNPAVWKGGAVHDGKSDATTIGIYWGKPNSLHLAGIALHELEHWTRASALLDEDGDGAGETAPPPDGGDPKTSRGKSQRDGNGVVTEKPNPCGPFEHAKMAVTDLQRYATASNVSATMCTWLCTNWNKWRTKINNEAYDAATGDPPCPDAENYSCIDDTPWPPCCQ